MGQTMRIWKEMGARFFIFNLKNNKNQNVGEFGNGMEIELNQSVAEKLDGNENGRNDREKGEDGEESESVYFS